jgi:ubiquitin-conjugating enzyme E2 C
MNTTTKSACIKRLEKERCTYPYLKLSPLILNDEKRFQWTLEIPGPIGSPYEGQIHLLEIAYDSSYPFSAPYLRFVSPIFHPNIHPSGRMSNLMIECWSPIKTIETLYDNAQELLKNPLNEFPYNEEADDLWRNNLPKFLQKVKSIYASTD